MALRDGILRRPSISKRRTKAAIWTTYRIKPGKRMWNMRFRILSGSVGQMTLLEVGISGSKSAADIGSCRLSDPAKPCTV